MPDVQPAPNSLAGIASLPGAGIRAEIGSAATRTGVDFDYLLGQAALESSLNPQARASTSSASGLFQFISSTWLSTVNAHGEEHGLSWAAEAIEMTEDGPVVRDPAMRSQILALRFDPRAASLMAGELANDNRDALRSAIGREPSATDLYLAHFLGAEGASKFLTSAASDPGQSAAALFPRAATANTSIFYDNGRARSLAEVHGLFEGKLARAIERHGGELPPGMGLDLGGVEFASARADWSAMSGNFQAGSFGSGNFAPGAYTAPASGSTVSAPALPQRASMAETLRASFGLDGASGSDPAMANVRQAYGQLQAFNL